MRVGIRKICSVRKFSSPLCVALVLGSTRVDGPPFPAQLGKRVGTFIEAELSSRGHDVIVIDPVEESLELLRRPQFAYGKNDVPAQLKDMAISFARADCYVMVTPEYNHAPSPALLNILNHFGSSLFSFKPSAIVSYSAGQWGGTRAAHSLRPILSELGCIPVSSMVHVPKAQEVFNEHGQLHQAAQEGDSKYSGKEPSSRGWSSYMGRTWAQLEWWGEAARHQRRLVDPLSSSMSPILATSPSQRNAP